MASESARLRTNMKAVIKQHGLTVAGWARDAGVSESGVRGFLKGTAATLTFDVLAKLAAAGPASLGDLIGISDSENPVYSLEDGAAAEVIEPLEYQQSTRPLGNGQLVAAILDDSDTARLFEINRVGDMLLLTPTSHRGVKGTPLSYSPEDGWHRGFVTIEGQTHSCHIVGVVQKLIIPYTV